MNDRFHRLRRVSAVLAGLAVAATISVAAPAVASAAPVKGDQTVVVVDLPAKGGSGSGGTVTTNDWTW